ncbi:RNA exonuclease 1 homolog isoform X1 [Pogona vitticeps]
MLRSSGFFRGVECPFGPACGRPYCHFRHPPGAPLTAAAAGPPGLPLPPRRPSSSRSLSGCGYDPYNPELPKPVAQSSNGALEDLQEPSAGILELELVNRAIEAAQNEYERDKKKYEELLETAKECGAADSPSLGSELAGSQLFPSLEYIPGSYEASGTADYHPTPLASAATSDRSSKYTLDSSSGGKSRGSALEYVPTVVTQPKKYSCLPANSKYVVDKSKPSTDLEYDPLSNYSARLLSKARAQKETKRKRAVERGEPYSPPHKQRRDSSSDPEPPARFSDSDEEPPGPSGRPSKSKGDAGSESPGGPVARDEGARPTDPASRQMKETAVQYDMGDIQSHLEILARDSKGAKLARAPTDGGLKGDGKEKPKEKVKKKNADSRKTEGKKEQGRTAEKAKTEAKSRHRNGERGKEKQTKRPVDGPLKKPSKARSSGGVDSKGVKLKPDQAPRPGKAEAGGKKDSKPPNADSKKKAEALRAPEKDGKGQRPRPERPQGMPTGAPSTGGSGARCKAKQRALSHADLFGDESGDEGAAADLPEAFPDVSSDSEGDGACFALPRDHRGLGVKRPKPSRSPSSSSSSSNIDYSLLEKELDLESDPMEECLRIFNESTDVKTEDKGRMGKQPSKDEGAEEKGPEDNLTTLFPGQKRRISHVAKQGNADGPSKPVVRPYRPPTAQEACYQRIQMAQKQAAQLVQQQQVQPSLATPQRSTPLATHKGERRRIAHVPNAAVPLSLNSAHGRLKKTPPPGSNVSTNGTDAPSLKARTLAGMSSKTTTTTVPKRVAHAPTLQSATLKRPVIPTEFGAKVPTNIRQRYLNLFIDECLKACPSPQEAFEKALSEEKVAYDRSTSRNIYLNVAVNTLKKLRSLLPGPAQEMHKNSNRKVVSHEAMLGGKLAAKTSFSIHRSVSLRVEDLTGAALYQRLKEYLLTEENLKEHGYPLPCPEKAGRAVVFTAEEKKTAESSCRICCRCGTEYTVTPSGNCVRREECVHHWGRLRKQRVPGGWETHYSCCSGAVGSPGCQVARQHVHDGRKDSLEGFVKTFEKPPSADGHPGIYALDCEMCYTKQGLELTRVTVINSDLQVVYDTFVKPDHKVVDYNTRFSGVTEADLENTSITLRDVQAVLLSMFCADTILIGHSLESDLFALKLIHCTVVDTAVVFPHRLGLPYKRALRTLMADYLKRIIQDSVEGHDSSEDARACMELMIWRIKEDAKVKR